MDFETLRISSYFGDSIAIILVMVLFAGNWWRLKDRTGENKSLFALLVCTLAGSAIDIVCWMFDGVPGNFSNKMGYAANSLLYLDYVLLSLFWFMFLVEHMKFRLKFAHKAILGGMLSFGVFIIILNLFIPVAFVINETTNSYERLLGYYLFLFIDHGLVVDSLCLYLIARKRGGIMKLFPVWIYVFPFVIGTLVQSFALGISLLPISFAVSIAGVLACLQGNVVYYDHLTGVLNKVYLESVAKRYSRKNSEMLAGVIVNITDFKGINQVHGKDVGDEVLVYLARILSKNVGELGNVARYSADEFIAVLNVKNEMAVSLCIARIKADILDYNKKRDCPCKIDVRIGNGRLDFAYDSVNKTIDGLEQLIAKENFVDKA